jgi:hypothetical protein
VVKIIKKQLELAGPFWPPNPEAAHHDSEVISISPQYFADVGIPALEGRTFNADDPLQPKLSPSSIKLSQNNISTLRILWAGAFVSLVWRLHTALAWLLTRFLCSSDYGLKSNAPMTLVAVSRVLTLAAPAPTLLPPRRAMRVDPKMALHYE